MLLRVKPLLGEEKSIEVDPTEDISIIKQKLEEVEGTPAEQQRLIYQGRFLKDGKSVEQYRLKPGVLLQMVKALRSR